MYVKIVGVLQLILTPIHFLIRKLPISLYTGSVVGRVILIGVLQVQPHEVSLAAILELLSSPGNLSLVLHDSAERQGLVAQITSADRTHVIVIIVL